MDNSLNIIEMENINFDYISIDNQKILILNIKNIIWYRGKDVAKMLGYKKRVECDENNNNYRDKHYEENREKFIKNKLNCLLIRYNHDNIDFSITLVIKEIYDEILLYNRILKNKFNILSNNYEQIKYIT